MIADDFPAIRARMIELRERQPALGGWTSFQVARGVDVVVVRGHCRLNITDSKDPRWRPKEISEPATGLLLEELSQAAQRLMWDAEQGRLVTAARKVCHPLGINITVPNV